MGPINLDGFVTGLIIVGMLICLGIWGCWELIDWLFIDDGIRVTKPLVPELELVVKDNVVDTVYIYRFD